MDECIEAGVKFVIISLKKKVLKNTSLMIIFTKNS